MAEEAGRWPDGLLITDLPAGRQVTSY